MTPLSAPPPSSPAISGGSPSGSPPPPRPCSSAPPMAATTRPATGSTSERQDGSVDSTQPVRVHAWGPALPAGREVTGSSQRSASRQASAISRSSAPVTGRSSARVAPVATSVARSQLTGPPDQLIRRCSCAKTDAMSPPPNGPPAPPNIADRPNGSFGSPGSSGRSDGPNPKGGRVIGRSSAWRPRYAGRPRDPGVVMRRRRTAAAAGPASRGRGTRPRRARCLERLPGGARGGRRPAR
jgi:hypothetical protein